MSQWDPQEWPHKLSEGGERRIQRTQVQREGSVWVPLVRPLPSIGASVEVHAQTLSGGEGPLFLGSRAR